MVIADISKDHILVQVPPVVGAKLDGVYLKGRSLWKIPHNLGALRDLHKLGYDVLHMGTQLSEEYKAIVHSKNRISTQHMDSRLREYQKQDVSFLLDQQYAGVFNEQRTGEQL